MCVYIINLKLVTSETIKSFDHDQEYYLTSIIVSGPRLVLIISVRTVLPFCVTYLAFIGKTMFLKDNILSFPTVRKIRVERTV